MENDIEVVSNANDDLSPKAKNLPKRRSEKSCRRFNGRIHIASTIMVIMMSMMILDGYLVQQNVGNRKTGVMVMLLIGDVCLLFILRYVGVWVGTEVHSAQRGCSMAEWFLFVFVLDIKIYFVMEGIRKGCFEKLETAASSEDNGTPSSKLTQLGQQSIYDNIINECDYSLLTKKSLTLFQSICIPSLYILLVGADYLENLSDFRSLEEVKMRTFWVVVDLLDLLDLQATVWEAKQGEPPYLTVGFIYFYCYIVLIILPPLSLAEMSKGKEMRPHAMIVYLIASFVTVNVATTAIRVVLLVSYGLGTVSAVFIGKNVICTSMKIAKLIQIYLIKSKRLQFTEDEDTVPFSCQTCAYRESITPSGCNPRGDDMQLKNTDDKPRPYYMFSDDDSVDCSNKSNANSVPYLPSKEWKPSTSAYTSAEDSRDTVNSFGGVVNLVTKLNRFSKQHSGRDPSSVSSLECAQQSPCDNQLEKHNFQPVDSFNEGQNFRSDYGERSTLLVQSASGSSLGAIDYSPFQSSEKKVRFRRERDGIRKAIISNSRHSEPTGEDGKHHIDTRSPSTEQSCSTATTESGINELRDKDIQDSRPPSYLKAHAHRNGLYRLSEVVSTEEQTEDGINGEQNNFQRKIENGGGVLRSASTDRYSSNQPQKKISKTTTHRSDSANNPGSCMIPIANGNVRSNGKSYLEREYEMNIFGRKNRIRSCEMLDERSLKTDENCEQFVPNQSIYSKSVCTMPMPRRKSHGLNGGFVFNNSNKKGKEENEMVDSDSEYTAV